MADQRITDLSPITGPQVAANDVFVLVDVSDTSMAPSGTNKKLTKAELGNRLTLDGFLKGNGSNGQLGFFDGAGDIVGNPALTFDGSNLQVGSLRIPGSGTPALGGDAITLDYFNANTIKKKKQENGK